MYFNLIFLGLGRSGYLQKDWGNGVMLPTKDQRPVCLDRVAVSVWLSVSWMNAGLYTVVNMFQWHKQHAHIMAFVLGCSTALWFSWVTCCSAVLHIILQLDDYPIIPGTV